MLSKSQRHDAIWHACRANDVTHLAFSVQLYFTKRMTRSYGSIYYASKKIFLSETLFLAIPDVKKYECLVHLACHMVVRYKWERQNKCKSLPRAHGYEWRAAMRRANVPATSAYCYVPATEKASRHTFGCDCSPKLKFHKKLAESLIAHPHDCCCCEKPMALLQGA